MQQINTVVNAITNVAKQFGVSQAQAAQIYGGMNPGQQAQYGASPAVGSPPGTVTQAIMNTAPPGTNFGTNFGPPGVANPYGTGNVGMVRGSDPNAALSQTAQNAMFGPSLAGVNNAPGLATPAQQQQNKLAQLQQALTNLYGANFGNMPGMSAFGPSAAGPSTFGVAPGAGVSIGQFGSPAAPSANPYGMNFGNMPGMSAFGQNPGVSAAPAPGPGAQALASVMGTPSAPYGTTLSSNPVASPAPSMVANSMGQPTAGGRGNQGLLQMGGRGF